MVPLIIEYTNLLHKHKNPNAKELKKFLKDYADDEVLQKRCKILNKLYMLKKML